jgi:aminopeptidase N
MKYSFFTIILVLLLGQYLNAQFTLADSLRGQLRPERSCYDVKFYDLNLDLNFKTKHIKGYNTIIYKVVRGFNMLQIDLFSNMKIDSIIHQGSSVKFYRRHNAVFVDLEQMQEEDIIDSIRVYYQGIPKIAINAPWDGGFTWTKDKNGKDWLGVSCEGIGASLWWPNKDHLSDEPDSMRINCTVPSDLTCVSNGNLRSKTKKGEKTSFDWFVSYPINNYNVTLNVADYVHFSDTFISPTDGSKLAMDYYVLPYNLTAAKKQFKEAHEVLRIFEKYLDKYPFWNDGYALVETPYLGMEHQSCIAYGNQFMPGYLGRHPIGMPEDFIILHETGHEWWGNSVSCVDHGEMWIHETFCTYMEAVFMEEKYGKDAAEKYLKYHNLYIANNQPILGPKDVNYDNHDSDMYYKGSSMLHTLRTSIGNDKLWWDILKTFYQRYKIKPAVTEDFINLVNEKTGFDYTYFFNQYLKNPELPILHYEIKAGKNGTKVINYKWKKCVANFKMPVYLNYRGKISKLDCSNEINSYELNLRKDEEPKFIFGLYRVVEIENGKEIEKYW